VVSSDNHPIISFNQLQYIPYDSLPGSMNMALDHFLSEKCQQNDQPILRFYGWKPYCVSIGFHQKLDLLDLGKLKHSGIDVIKRPTGGRAIFHAEELTYSIICPRNIIHHKNLYRFFHQLFADSLHDLGYLVDLKTDNEKLGGLTHRAEDFHCFTKSAQTEIQIQGKKLIGSAQKIYDKTILQHGSLLIGNEYQRLTKFLNIPVFDKKEIEKDVKQKTICLDELKRERISQEKIIESILNQLELVRGISVNSRSLTEAEIDSAKRDEKMFGMSFPRNWQSI
jgi:lipoate-protein ligase A